MKSAKTILAVLVAACCFTCTLEAWAASLATLLITTFERGEWSNVIRVQVAQREGPISVNLETLDSPPFRVGEPLRFAARTEGTGLRLEHQFLFGDGRATTWTRENTVRYTYREAGTFQAAVFVREQSLEGQGPPSATRSGRAMLRIVIEPDPMKDDQQAVRLNAYPTEVRADGEVRLEARVEPETEDLEFVFAFGDGEQSERQSVATTFHRYANPGAYATFVRAYRGDRLVGESRPVNIIVTPQITHRLFLEADNTNLRTMERVRFTWNIEPPAAGVLYHIDFGDSYGGWVSETYAEHAYRDRGEYRVLLKARIGGRDIQSNELVVAVQEAVRTWLYLSLAIALGVAGAGVLVWHIIARARNRKSGKAMKAGSVDTTIVMRPHKDLGARQLEFSTPVTAGLDVRFQPVLDIGEQVMERGVMTRKRKEENHG